jgi:hypothetical protein
VRSVHNIECHKYHRKCVCVIQQQQQLITITIIIISIMTIVLQFGMKWKSIYMHLLSILSLSHSRHIDLHLFSPSPPPPHHLHMCITRVWGARNNYREFAYISWVLEMFGSKLGLKLCVCVWYRCHKINFKLTMTLKSAGCERTQILRREMIIFAFHPHLWWFLREPNY